METTTHPHAQESGHWYDRTGMPVYSVKSADGKRDVRPDIRHARKLGLVPGYTSVKKMLAQPGLERWQIQQAILAALTLPRLPNESEAKFLTRLEADRQAWAKQRAQEGTDFHKAVEQALNYAPFDQRFDAQMLALRKALIERFSIIQFDCEKSFAHPLGYGGRIDAIGPTILLDFKTKESIGRKTDHELFFDEHVMQLACYRRGLRFTGECASILVGLKDAVIRIKVWRPSEIQRGLQLFDHALAVWKLKNNYDSGWMP